MAFLVIVTIFFNTGEGERSFAKNSKENMKENFIVNSTSEDMLLMLIFPRVEKIIGEKYEKQSGENVSWDYGRVHSVDFVIGKDDVWYEMELSLLIGEVVKKEDLVRLRIDAPHIRVEGPQSDAEVINNVKVDVIKYIKSE